MKTILFTGGGSAGHVVPNLAIMNELRYSHRVLYMGTNGIERGLVEKAGYPFYEIECPKLVRSLTLKNLTIPFRLSKAVNAAKEVLEKERPDLVFSKGGFVSFPAVSAAHKLGIPALTHESDLSAGLCTKLIAKKCKRVLTSFPEAADLFKNGEYVGSPIRKEILRGEKSRARKKFSLSEQKPVLLVLGGGSGSRAINEAVRANLKKLLKIFDILHLTGKGNLIKEETGYIQREFEQDMGSAYAAADVVLCRAGSNTVFELLCLKKPCLLIPLKKGSRGDQLENALYFEKKGLCRVLDESEISDLYEEITKTYRDEALKNALGTAHIENGLANILNLIEKYSNPNPSAQA